MDGVVRTRVGYAGGTTSDPTYRRIGDHMETIQIDYDPEKITYRDLLNVFLDSHDASWQSPVRQYASAIFTHDVQQEEAARAIISQWESTTGRKAATFFVPYAGFTLAEDYHQKYSLRSAKELLQEFEAVYPDGRDFVNSTAAARVNGYLSGYGNLESFARERDGLGMPEEKLLALENFIRAYGGKY